jgi:hypothetical protein
MAYRVGYAIGRFAADVMSLDGNIYPIFAFAAKFIEYLDRAQAFKLALSIGGHDTEIHEKHGTLKAQAAVLQRKLAGWSGIGMEAISIV